MDGRYWNYRVVEFADGDDLSWSICEVHYEDDKPVGYSLANVVWDSADGYWQGLEAELRRIKGAADKPVLSEREAKGEAVP